MGDTKQPRPDTKVSREVLLAIAYAEAVTEVTPQQKKAIELRGDN